MVKKFIRRTWNRYSKLGKKRKKKQVWRRPTGRDNKMREKRKGYPAIVGIGHKKNKKLKGKIKEKIPVLVKNINDLKKIKKEQVAIIANIGKKKKIEIAKKAKEMKINLHNLNIKKFLEKNKKKEAKESKKTEIKKADDKIKKTEKSKEKNKKDKEEKIKNEP